jgi:hypothetical protein
MPIVWRACKEGAEQGKEAACLQVCGMDGDTDSCQWAKVESPKPMMYNSCFGGFKATRLWAIAEMNTAVAHWNEQQQNGKHGKQKKRKRLRGAALRAALLEKKRAREEAVANDAEGSEPDKQDNTASKPAVDDDDDDAASGKKKWAPVAGEAAPVKSTFIHTFEKLPFGLSLKVTKTGAGKPTVLKVSKVKVIDIEVAEGDVLLSAGSESVSGWSLKKIGELLKAAELPIDLSFERSAVNEGAAAEMKKVPAAAEDTTAPHPGGVDTADAGGAVADPDGLAAAAAAAADPAAADADVADADGAMDPDAVIDAETEAAAAEERAENEAADEAAAAEADATIDKDAAEIDETAVVLAEAGEETGDATGELDVDEEEKPKGVMDMFF